MSNTLTQRELADRIGVTPVLVSRALSGHPSVAARTRERIEAAAREFGYRADSNIEARVMSARRHGKRVHTDIIAVLMPNYSFAGMALSRLPFFATFIDGIEEAAARLEIDVHLCTVREGRMSRLVERNGVDGVICLGGFDYFNEIPLPTVNFGGAGQWAMGVYPDNREGARLATSHLIELGHRRIAYLAYAVNNDPANYYSVTLDRIDGYRRALGEAGIAVEEHRIGGFAGHPTIEAGAEAMSRLLQTSGGDFTAVVCFNDVLAMGAVQALRAVGHRTPEDVSVVGFDDVTEQYPFEPKLTSIAFDRYAMGMRAVHMVHAARAATEDGSPLPKYDEIFSVKLVARHSSARPPLETK